MKIRGLGIIKKFIPTKQGTWQKSLGLSLSLALLMVCSGAMGALAGYYQAAGEYPFMKTGAILPDVPEETTTLTDVGHFLERDKTDELDYGENINCVEYALLVARNAHWEGMPAEAGSLVYEDGSRHMILIFPTEDEGWIFVDPQSDLVINPRVGVIYNGRRIVEIDILRCNWIPFEVSK